MHFIVRDHILRLTEKVTNLKQKKFVEKLEKTNDKTCRIETNLKKNNETLSIIDQTPMQ